MYLRAIHAEHHIPSLRKFIHDNPLGLLITSFPSSFATIQTTHLPWVLDVSEPSSESELGTLRGHLARANPHAKALTEAARSPSLSTANRLTAEVSVMFTSANSHYITPKFYVDTKPATGKVVPTWNYAAVQVYGMARIYWDSTSAETGPFLQQQVSDLSRHAEMNVMGYDRPWSVDDAPERYIELMKKSILGIEIDITRLEGKWKMSQELAEGDRHGVVEGFKSLSSEIGATMAAAVETRAALKAEEKRQNAVVGS